MGVAVGAGVAATERRQLPLQGGVPLQAADLSGIRGHETSQR